MLTACHSGYPHSDNTWEPRENLECDELIAAFELELKKKAKAANGKKQTPTKKIKKEVKEPVSDEGESGSGDSRDDEVDDRAKKSHAKRGRGAKTRGAGRGGRRGIKPATSKTDDDLGLRPPKKPQAKGHELNLDIQEIKGVKQEGIRLFFEVVYVDREGVELCPAEIANTKYIKDVLKFYKAKLEYYEGWLKGAPKVKEEAKEEQESDERTNIKQEPESEEEAEAAQLRRNKSARKAPIRHKRKTSCSSETGSDETGSNYSDEGSK